MDDFETHSLFKATKKWCQILIKYLKEKPKEEFISGLFHILNSDEDFGNKSQVFFFCLKKILYYRFIYSLDAATLTILATDLYFLV